MGEQMNPTERLEEARTLARSFRQHLPETERRLYDEALPKAGPLT